MADDHVVEEIAELGDGEGHASAEDGLAGLGADLVVLVTDRSEGLEVGVDEENVSSLDVTERGSDVGFAGSLAGAHHFLNPLVEEHGGHDHSVGLAVVGNEFEDTSS